MSTLPYTPTTLLAPKQNQDIVYVLDLADDGSSSVRLRAINVSSSLTSSLSYIDISDDVPFGGTPGTAYTSFASENGTIYTLAGDCKNGASGAAAWTYTPDPSPTSGIWAQAAIDVEETGNSTVGGANYLAGGLAFSSNLNATADMYIFGGMCPTSSGETATTWQSGADYSNTLLHLERSTAVGSSSYSLETVGSRGPPIPEAGFTVTPLSPSYFNSTTGNVTLQQNFVLLGGHTQSAFINMSQVAVLSLPEQTWTFLPVADPPASKKRAALLDRGTDTIDPRSGHTAVLSENGQQIILLGGWVGDVNTPADPQLAILDIGDGYGGSGNWQWTVPSTTGSGPGSTGIYGHGAAMLPGNVLMVSGGVQIGAGQGELVKRSSTPDAYFFNVSSNSWITAYQNPHADNASRASGDSTSDRTKIGLGAGLGVGLAAILIALLVYWWIRRKKRREQKIHANDLRALALGNDQLRSPILGFGGVDGRGGDPDAAKWAGHPGEEGANAYSWAPALPNQQIPGQARRSEAERTGVLIEVPSPTRGLRRSLNSRSHHWSEDGRRSRGSSYIHPIDEREEYEQSGMVTLSHPTEMVQVHDQSLVPRPLSRRLSDPFRDPPSQRSLLDGSRSPSPQMPLQAPGPDQEDTIQLLLASVESDPDQPIRKSHERTSSSLSHRSMVSALSQQPAESYVSIDRSQSQSSAALFSTRPVVSSTDATELSSSLPSPPQAVHRTLLPVPSDLPAIKRRPLPLSAHPTHSRVSAALQPGIAAPGSSPSSFSQLQAEGPDLLLGGSSPEHHRSNGGAYAAADADDDFDAEPLSRRRPQSSRPRSWMGSVRRALAASATAASHSSRSTTPSPAAGRSTANSPRRSEFFPGPNDNAADTARLAWGVPSGDALSRSRPQHGARAWTTNLPGPIGDWGAPPSPSGYQTVDTDEGEWDVESAVEQRVVQVVYTVPREKLRVVNRAPEEADERSLRSARSLPELDMAANSAPSAQASAVATASPAAARVPSAEHAHVLRLPGPPARHHVASFAARSADHDDPNFVVHATDEEEDDQDDENIIIHAATDDEADASDDDDNGGGMLPQVSAPHGYQAIAVEPALTPAPVTTTIPGHVPKWESSPGSGPTGGRVAAAVKALEWRQRRNAAVERLRAASGEEAVERVRAASGESGRASAATATAPAVVAEAAT